MIIKAVSLVNMSLIFMTFYGCGVPQTTDVRSTLINPMNSFGAVPEDSVLILVDPTQLEGMEFKYIAELRVESTGSMYNVSSPEREDQLTERLRIKAGQVGANAILYPVFDHLVGRGYSKRTAKTIAIRIFSQNTKSQ